MPPRKKAKPVQASASASYSHEVEVRSTRSNVHPTRSSVVQSESPAGCDGPITRSLASARSRSDVVALVTSPIRNLPLEVLADIFMLAMHTECVDLYPKKSMNRSEIESRQKILLNPLALCSVCSSWRFLAFSVPKLWTRVFVDIQSGMGKAQAQRKAAGLVQWIKRSHMLPLVLYIFADVSVPLDGTGRGAPIVSVINDYASHWEALYLQSTTEDPFESLHRSHSFRFDGWHSLRRLCSPDSRSPSYKNQSIPWAQLTHLQIHPYMTALDATIVLKECPKLVQLSISVGICCTTLPITLHNLVSLSLSTHSLSHVVDSLFLPSLRDMYITGLSILDVEPLSNFFTRSSCTLDKLELSALSLRPRDQLLNLLGHESCNSLTSLKLQELRNCPAAPVSDEVFRRLTLHEEDTLCPRLKYLTIDCSIKCSVSTLQKMVESRNGFPDCQRRDELLQCLCLRLAQCSNKLDKFGNGCEMEYTRRLHDRGDRRPYRFYSISFRRRDLSSTQLRINHSGFFF